MDLERLRRETEPDHLATENVMPLMHADLTRDTYVAVLRRLYVLVKGWESWASANASGDLCELVAARRRAPLLARDLEVLGSSPEDAWEPFPAEQIPGLRAGTAGYRASFLGAMYVMEGSTLGGQHIARHVEAGLGLRTGEGNAYFRGYGERTGSMWRAFKMILGELPESDSDCVILAAKSMFGVFRKGMELAGIRSAIPRLFPGS